MTVEKDSYDKSLVLGEKVREKFHADWKSKSLTVVEGLKKEFSESSRVGSSMLFIGFVLSVMSALALTEVIPTENTPAYVLALATFLGALFLMIGVAMKASKKDILYMLDAENEILRLNEQLDKQRQGQDQGSENTVVTDVNNESGGDVGDGGSGKTAAGNAKERVPTEYGVKITSKK